MRKTIVLFTTFLLVVAGQAGAKTLDWHGTLDIDLGALPTLRLQGSGVATVNNSSGGNHLNTLRIAGGITGNGTIPVTDPDTVGTIPSIRITGTLGTGTLSGISGTAPLHPPATLALKGVSKVCLYVPGCNSFLPLNNTTNSGNTGVGIGGQLTIGQYGAIRISVVNGPWTLGTATGTQATVDGGFRPVSAAGFVHGAASSNSSTATGSGLIQLIAPQAITVTGIAGNNSILTLFAALTIHFIPEPGLLLLIGSGVVGLGLLGRSRMKK